MAIKIILKIKQIIDSVFRKSTNIIEKPAIPLLEEKKSVTDIFSLSNWSSTSKCIQKSIKMLIFLIRISTRMKLAEKKCTCVTSTSYTISITLLIISPKLDSPWNCMLTPWAGVPPMACQTTVELMECPSGSEKKSCTIRLSITLTKEK